MIQRRSRVFLLGAATLTIIVAVALQADAQGQTSADQTTVGSGVVTETAIFAGGCFWCVEKDFDHVAGVLSTTSGYIGGATDNPTYQSHGPDGHLEAVSIVYDPSVVSYEALAHTFLRTVDVTDDGGQFCDRGNSYRTAFFVLDEEQRMIAEAEIAEGEQALDRSIVTRILDATTFWPAEGYHQDYYLNNPLRYQFYRTSCRRNSTVERVWGEEAYAGVNQG